MNSLTAIVVEDEGPSRRKILKMLRQKSESIEVLGEASNGVDGAKLANKLKPEVVFLDIQMPGMTGFEMLKSLDYRPLVVFTTAYQEYAIKAFEENAVDYLLKPIEAERLKKCIDRLIDSPTKVSVDDIESTIRKIQARNEVPEIISVKSGDRVIPIRLEEIFYFQAEDKLVRIFSSRGNNFLIDNSLNTLEGTLPDNFIRIHRSHIINTSHVLELRKYFNSRYMIYINDESASVLTSGKSYYDSIKSYFQL
jgi:two-component system LytT family response regulator